MPETPAERRRRRAAEEAPKPARSRTRRPSASEIAAGKARIKAKDDAASGSMVEPLRVNLGKGYVILEGWDSPTVEAVPVQLDELRAIRAADSDTVTLLSGWDGKPQSVEPGDGGGMGRQLPYDMGTNIRVTRVVERDAAVKASPPVPPSSGTSGALLGHVIELELLNKSGSLIRLDKQFGRRWALYVDDELVYQWDVDHEE